MKSTLCFVVAFACGLPAGIAFAQSPAAKHPVPDADALQQSTKLCKEVYGDEYAKCETDEQKQNLATKLLAKAQESESDPPAQYVLLRLAKDVAAQASDGATAFKAIDAMDDAFSVDAIEMKSAVLTKIASTAKTDAQHKSVAELALEAMTQAVAADSFVVAVRLGELADGEARKARDKDLLAEVQSKVGEAKVAAKEYLRVEEAKATLEKTPDDPPSNLIVGKYECFVKNDWDKGLPMLVLGNDAALKALAKQELGGVASSSEQARLGDAWWELGEKGEGAEKKLIRRRAVHWYEIALPGLAGLAKAKAGKRLKDNVEDVPGNRSRVAKSVYLADLQATEVRIINGTKDLRIDEAVGGKSSKHNLSAQPPGKRNPSHIQYEPAGRFKFVQGSAAIADITKPRTASALTFRIVGDGKLLWQSHPMQASGSSEPFRVSVAKIKTLELFVECPGSNGDCHAVWVEPIVER